MSNYICSPMNYIGGKYKLLPQILPLFPKRIDTFIDMFCGGGNVGVNVEANKLLLNDNLLYIVELYKQFKTMSIDEIVEYIENRINLFELSSTNTDGYLALRSAYNQERNPLDLFVLAAYSFNHQIRFNNNHQFNIPFGKNRSRYNANMKKNLEMFIAKLHELDVEFSSSNFEELDLSGLTSNDFVYCDPPYLITTGTYNDGKRGFTGWSHREEIKLLALLSELNRKGIRFALSNVLKHKGRTNAILKQWVEMHNFKVYHLNKDYQNSNYHSINRDSDITDEVLITNYIVE